MQKETVGLADGGDAQRTRFHKGTESRPTLADAGIDKKLSSRAQKLAAVPDEQFEGMVGEWRSRTPNANPHSLYVAPPDSPVNNAAVVLYDAVLD